MCGILAVINIGHSQKITNQFTIALSKMRHRGPDDEGYIFCYNNPTTVIEAIGNDSICHSAGKHVNEINDSWIFAMGHRRLSIIDLTIDGHQPMQYNNRYWISFNGEIYNYIEIKEELKSNGFIFSSKSDTEVILAAYSYWGESCLSKFIGMFAFIIYDRETNSLFVARDQFGIKPLYKYMDNEKIIFSSEIFPIFSFNVKREGNPTELFTYFKYGTTAGYENTIFKNITVFQPGTFCKYDVNKQVGTDNVVYWDLNNIKPRNISFGEAVSTIKEIFFKSIELHLRSDAPLGACLSGGLDSTAILYVMEKFTNKKIDTFSYIASENNINEERYVDVAVSSRHVNCHKIYVKNDDLEGDIDELMRFQELPFLGTSIYAQYKVFQLAKSKKIKVMLDGQGSDEIFGGYYTSMAARICSEIAKGNLLSAVKIIKGISISSTNERIKLIIRAIGSIFPSNIADYLLHMFDRFRVPWIRYDLFEKYKGECKPIVHGSGRYALNMELAQSIKRNSLPSLLHFEDRNSMASSIESRVPFCTTNLVEVAFSLPNEYLISENGETKYAFREAMKGIVPEVILRRPKLGFNTPENAWMYHLKPYVMSTLQSNYATEFPFINCNKLQYYANHVINNPKHNNAMLWRVFNVLKWGENNHVSWNI